MIFAAIPGNQLPLRSPALRAILHHVGSEMSQQLRTALDRSALTVHFGRQALVLNLANRFHANSPVTKLIASQPPLPTNALAGLPNLRYSVLYADSINGAAISHWLKAMLAAKGQKQATGSREIRNFLAAVADHTGTGAIMLPPIPSKLPTRPDMVNPWASGPAIIIQYSRHPKAQMHNLAAYFNGRPATIEHGTTSTHRDMQIIHATVSGYQSIRIAMPAKKPGGSSHHIELINIGSHRVLVGVDTTEILLKSAIAAAKENVHAISKRPGLAQIAGEILPGTFAAAYLPIARWNQLQNTTTVPKAANALTLGLPPPPAVFSVGTGKRSLNMQLYIPVATLEQSLSGNSAGALF
ncbi:MAG: hypothetical protein ACYCUV_09500, partial [Phycisphaerae bacterium]